jgi:hypothetical protein
MDLVKTFAKVRRLAVAADTPIEQFMRSMEVVAQEQEAEESANRSSGDEREKMEAYVATLDGKLESMTAADIAAGAGVRTNRGTSQFASRLKKRTMLLRHGAQS